MIHISFLACTKVELWDLAVCIAVNGEKRQSCAVTLTLVRQCPISKPSEIFSYTTRKRFSEKTIVAFTITTVLILDFYIYDQACLVSCFGLEFLDFEDSSYNQLPGSPNR